MLFFDVDTQFDFMHPKGALYVEGALDIQSNIEKLLSAAGVLGITTISTSCAHVEDDAEFEIFPPHCIEGTPGAERIHDDLPALPRYEVSASTTDEQAAQLELLPATHYVVRKRVFNPFSNRWLQRLRDEGAFKDEEVIVFGVATDYCVREAVLGLIEGGATVSLVGDAIKGVAPESTTQSHSHFNSLGVAMVSSDEVLQLARKRALEMSGA